MNLPPPPPFFDTNNLLLHIDLRHGRVVRSKMHLCK